MASPTLIQASGYQLGIGADETGINITSDSQTFTSPKVYVRDKYGGRKGFAQGHDPEHTTTISGETTTDPDAVMGVAFATAETLANEIDGYGITTGDQLLDDITVDSSNDGNTFRNATLNFTRLPGLTVA